MTSFIAAPVYADVERLSLEAQPVARARRRAPRPHDAPRSPRAARLGGERRVLADARRGNASGVPPSGGRSVPSRATERAERVAKPRVDGERPVGEPASSAVVVDRERRVEGGRTPLADRRVEQRLMEGRSKPATRSQPPRALRSSCATERNEKCSTSIGCQVRSGSSPGASALWFPRSTSTSGMRAMGDLLVRVEDRLLVARVGRRRETNGHPLGEERAVVRARQEVSPATADDAVARRARSPGRPSASRRGATRTRPRRS